LNMKQSRTIVPLTGWMTAMGNRNWLETIH
jgi:hypothetical protein